MCIFEIQGKSAIKYSNNVYKCTISIAVIADS